MSVCFRRVLALVFALSLLSSSQASAQDTGPFDLVIQGGRVVDPETGFDEVANVGIRNGRVVLVGTEGMSGERIIDASELGFLLRPGADQRAPDDRTIDLLIHAATEDPVVMVRRMAFQSLGILSTDTIYSVLPQALTDESPDVRWMALASAARGGDAPDPRGTPFLIQALDDVDQIVRSRAYQRLRANTRQAFPFDPTAPIEQRRAQQDKWQEWWARQEQSPQRPD